MRFPTRNKLTNEKIQLDYEKDYNKNDTAIKPNGFWYGIKDKWYKFSKQELNERYKYIYKISLKKSSTTTIDKPDPEKLLVIRTISDLEHFRRKYFITTHDYSYDWTKLKKSFAGLEIRHYSKLKKSLYIKDSFYVFFSSLDVSSGVIWNLKTIKMIILL